jgi:ABC-2 type transport system permease protein
LTTKPKNLALVLSSLREKRATILAWAISGALAMYFEAIAIAAELRDYPGGPQALAQTIYPTIEGMRIIRWPADRLDTLGGYLAYHNIVLFNFFLGIFAAVQGARLIRFLEETRGIEFYLATGISRARIILLRSSSYFLSQMAISLALGVGTAFAMAASDVPDTSGSIITLIAGGICIFPLFGLGLLVSQFIQSARTAAGVTSIITTVIYVLDNISGKYEWLNWFQNISPFHYANLSRPVIPGFEADYLSWIGMFLVGSLLVLLSICIMQRRDIGATALELDIKNERAKKRWEFVPRTIIGDLLWRQRIGLLAWVITTSAFIGVFIAMMSGVIEVWRQFSFLEQFTALGFGDTPEKQYLAMVYEVLPPFLAAFVISQSAKWTSDLNQGRVQLILSAPFSWSGLILRRVVATLFGAELIIGFSIMTAIVGSNLQNVEIYSAAVFRVFVMSSVFAVAFASLNALLVAILQGRNATQLISIYVGAAWLIGFMAPYLNWPSWVVHFSIFDAFGHPFVEWPSTLNLTLISIMAIPGLIAAMLFAERTSKL